MPLYHVMPEARRNGRTPRYLAGLGPRRVEAVTAIHPDAGRALQELLRSIRTLAQADEEALPDEEDIRAEASALAEDLRQLGRQGYGTEGLLRSLIKTAGLAAMDAASAPRFPRNSRVNEKA
ncbi:MAG: hypothetical protein LBD68_08850 [Zoogloeaceae bacterium]|nr:hypothetical protein [Zoogloeaceae bacterium]